jgi:SulP family sulfate permease
LSEPNNGRPGPDSPEHLRSRLVPKLLTVLREGYSLAQFRGDALAGVVVGIVALPLAIAFAIASGVRPEQGLYTAIIAGFLISAFGGSRVQIGGPTGAFIVIVYDVVHRFGYDGLAVATIMAGGMLVLMGLARLGVAWLAVAMRGVPVGSASIWHRVLRLICVLVWSGNR